MKNNYKIIKFIDSEYRELFKIPDGETIKVTYPEDDPRDVLVRECKYLDEYHFKIIGKGSNIYHICEFAETMESLGAIYEPLNQINIEIKPHNIRDNFRKMILEKKKQRIKHISGNFGCDGYRYFESWYDYSDYDVNNDINSEICKIMYSLRKILLRNNKTMIEYCKTMPDDIYCKTEYGKIYCFTFETELREYYLFCNLYEEQDKNNFSISVYNKSI